VEGSRLVGWLPLIPLLPFLGFVLNGLFGKRAGRTFVSWVGVGTPLVAFAVALATFLALGVEDRSTVVVARGGPLRTTIKMQLEQAQLPLIEGREDVVEGVIRVRAPVARVQEVLKRLGNAVTVMASAERAPRSWHGPGVREGAFERDIPWISVGGFQSSFRFVLDRLSGVLVLVVLGVGSLIHIYSLSYMETEDRGGFARYFAYLNFFTAMMLVLVLAGDLLLMFVGWEGVGLASYLLIGFGYTEDWKAAAGMKAFVVNRIGDLGFILGVLALATASIADGQATHTVATLNMDHLNALALAGKIAPFTLGAAALCLFLGATGKSAQIPLFVWLPDAMAGPTPVSALIHAATMVTAGVYMCCRMHPIFDHASVGGVPVLGIIALVGALTAIYAATSACGQDDVKKVLAYSTVSQLGYMFVGVGVGAYGAAIFHLVTHAFFKALLFLGAGALIHATGTQDLKKMGGLRGPLKTTYWTMAVGAAALAGIPGFAGFFSKDMILGHAFERAMDGPWQWGLVYVLGVVGGFLTAFYSMRLIVLAFFGKPGDAAAHAHESPPNMTVPLVVLAVLAILGGLLGLPAVGVPAGASLALPHFLDPILGTGAHAASGTVPAAAAEHAESASREVMAMLISTIAALGGAFVGWTAYAKGGLPVITEAETGQGALGPLKPVLASAWGIDGLYYRVFVDPLMGMASWLWEYVDTAFLDRGLVDGVGRLARGFGELVTSFQTGRVARYAAYVAVGAVAVLAVMVLS
jgi:NADH-quinone oxidoreductase subunit L